MPEYIYFDPQRGLVKSEPIRSNSYIYRLPPAALGRVELGVADAALKSNGELVYGPDFLAWLDIADTKWDQRTGLA